MKTEQATHVYHEIKNLDTNKDMANAVCHDKDVCQLAQFDIEIARKFYCQSESTLVQHINERIQNATANMRNQLSMTVVSLYRPQLWETCYGIGNLKNIRRLLGEQRTISVKAALQTGQQLDCSETVGCSYVIDMSDAKLNDYGISSVHLLTSKEGDAGVRICYDPDGSSCQNYVDIVNSTFATPKPKDSDAPNGWLIATIAVSAVLVVIIIYLIVVVIARLNNAGNQNQIPVTYTYGPPTVPMQLPLQNTLCIPQQYQSLPTKPLDETKI